ncbi:MAG: hypothetical protein V4568_09755 [Pseudomonadota bacterium]
MSSLSRTSFTALVATFILAGCTVTSTIKLYDGPDRDLNQVAMLYVDPHVVVSTLDGVTSKPGERVLVHSAGKRREIAALAPGHHELKAHFFVLCMRSDGDFPLEFTAEPGKKYRLKSGVDADQRRWKPSIVEYSGEDIEDNFPWTKAMCKVKSTTVLLPR